MKVILHIGAHRTGTTSFQMYMRREAAGLQGQGIGFWGPARTRKGLFAGIQPVPGLGATAAQRARGRILLQMDRAAQNGVGTLVVSDENMMGSVRRNLRARALYPDVGERLARYVGAFDGRIDTVILSVRALDHFWASTAAYGVSRGHAVPDAHGAMQIAMGARTWRDVVQDVACAAPGARIVVAPFETSAARPDTMLAIGTGASVPVDRTPDRLNKAPGPDALRSILTDRGEDPDQIARGTGRWTPFDISARAMLREAYADDMLWLVAGADGLATLTEDLDHARAGQTPPYGPRTRGHPPHDKQERRMAEPRGS
ncbi:hypothetical protein [uncultured Tateyamaria sp.]|uniref:hypothetical protein n=1 Tax=uncultured Tateyamaria sp. TaxID=455651 RepID=UPI00262FC474|nr:hypothetical protein [uncultured Tateyamaria sp.]